MAVVFPPVMYSCESWTVKKAEHQRIDAFELCFWRRLLRVTWTAVHPKGNQPWTFIGRTDAEAETPILWPPDVKSRLTEKDPDAGKDWRQEEERVSEDEMAGWLHWCNGHELGQTLGDGEGQGGLECYSPWGCKELDTTEWLNWTEHSGWSPTVPRGDAFVHTPPPPASHCTVSSSFQSYAEELSQMPTEWAPRKCSGDLRDFM